MNESSRPRTRATAQRARPSVDNMDDPTESFMRGLEGAASIVTMMDTIKQGLEARGWDAPFAQQAAINAFNNIAAMQVAEINAGLKR